MDIHTIKEESNTTNTNANDLEQQTRATPSNGNTNTASNEQNLDQLMVAGNIVEQSDSQNEEIPPELEMREEITSPPPEDTDLQNQGDGEQPKKNDDASNPICNGKTTKGGNEEGIQTPEEIKKIILTQAQLKMLSDGSDFQAFREIVIGCYVRVHVPGLQNYSDRIFIDQILDVLEPQSYQHLWLNQRFRLHHLGDFELDKIYNLKVQQNKDLQPWFDYIEAKGEQLPTLSFIHQKEQAINLSMQELAAKAKEAADGNNAKQTKLQIKRENLGQIVLNPVTLRQLAKLSYERFRQVVTGCFVCMTAIRKDKAKDCQYHVVRVLDCVKGEREYKLRNMANVNYQLVLPFYGKYIITWVRSFSVVTEQGFRNWLDDMKSWKQPIPTLDEIREKAAQLQLAINEAEQIPSFMDLEKQRLAQEEQAKRAKLPVQSAKDMDPCVLMPQQLQKLAALQDVNVLTRVITGCFVRMNTGAAAESGELDQILGVEIKEKKGGQTDKVLELKYAGTISLTALIYIVSPQKLSEQGFKEFVKKIQAEEGEQLPNYEFIEQKGADILATLEPEEAKKQKSNATEVAKDGKKPNESNGNKATSSGPSNDKKEQIEGGRPPPKEPHHVPTKDGKLTSFEMKKIVLSMKKMVDLMTLKKDTLAKVIRGFFARIAVTRNDKNQKEQYYVDEITGVSWGGEPYKVRGNILTDLRIHFKHLGEKALHQLYRNQGDNFNDEALTIFVEDMKRWKNPLPTLAFIAMKSRQFTDAVSKAGKLPRSRLRPFNRDRDGFAAELNFIGGNGLRPMPMTPMQSSQNIGYEQVQQIIQKQVMSSVRGTPGLSPSTWAAAPPLIQNQLQQKPFNPPFQAPQPQQHGLLNSPPMGNWQRQTDAFITGLHGHKRPMEDESFERESWRLHQQQVQQQQKQQQQQQQQQIKHEDPRFGGSFPPPPSNEHYRSTQRDMDSLMSIRDFPAIQSRHQGAYPQPDRNVGGHDYRRSYDADQLFGGGGGNPMMASTSQSAHYNIYVPSAPKRARQSPQPPPVERFF